jgi:hypothetical protein
MKNLTRGMLSLLFLTMGCAALTKYGKLEKSARQNYVNKNYDAAVFDCAASLTLKPDYDKAQALIKDAFSVAVSAHTNKINQLVPSSAKFKWDEIVSELEALIKLNETIKGLPTLTDKKTKRAIKFKTADYSDMLQKSKAKAAEAHYQEGLRLSTLDGVDLQKQAAKEFKAADQYQPGYKDAAGRYQTTRQAGVKRMAIIPFEDKSGKNGQYGAISETVVDEVVSAVMNDPDATEFLEIISRDRLEQVMQEQKLGLTGVIDQQTAVELGKVLGVYEIVTGKITQVIYTPERTVEENFREEGEIYVGKNQKRYVSAIVTVYTRTSGASITGSYQIIDIKTARLKKSDSFIGKEDFSAKWATYSGDKEALGGASRNLISRSEELAPVEEEMVSRAAHNLATSLAQSFKQYAR